MTSLDTMMVTACCMALAYAAGHDLAFRTIPNVIPCVLALLGLAHAAFEHYLLEAVVVASVVFLIGVGAWRVALIGGGDVKLIAAVSLWTKPHAEPTLFATIAIAGGILACVYLGLRHVLPAARGERPCSLVGRIWRVELRRVRRCGPLPYAVAIASATIFCLIPR